MWLFGKGKELLEVIAPHGGKVQKLANIDDDVFSKKMMGDGLVITPLQKLKQVDVLAPISGKLVTVFPTKHAFGIRTSSGKEVLVHVGLDTVNLKGKGFKIHVSQNKMVEAGAKLVTVDLDYVRKNARLASTIVIVTSGDDIKKPASGTIEPRELLFKV